MHRPTSKSKQLEYPSSIWDMDSNRAFHIFYDFLSHREFVSVEAITLHLLLLASIPHSFCISFIVFCIGRFPESVRLLASSLSVFCTSMPVEFAAFLDPTPWLSAEFACISASFLSEVSFSVLAEFLMFRNSCVWAFVAFGRVSAVRLQYSFRHYWYSALYCYSMASVRSSVSQHLVLISSPQISQHH